MQNGEVNIKINNKESKSKELDSECIKNVTQPSKKNKGNEQNNTKTGRKNQEPSISFEEPDIDKPCYGGLEEGSKNKIPNELNDVDQKIKSKNKKRKSEEDVELNNVEPLKVKKVKTNKGHEANDTQVKQKNKKIVFNDVSESQKSLATNKTNKLNEDEAEVKDEDIDKFCEEITDEDNETYENWVQLFEANFMKSKKSTASV